MAFLDNSGDIILDAVLTDTGRMRLAKGDGSFRIVKFALSDDEIDYTTFNKTHASGSAYFDLEILQTPILEAFTNNGSSMKSRLLSIPRTNLLYLPVIRLNQGNQGSRPNPTRNAHLVAVDTETENTFTQVVNIEGILHGANPEGGGKIRCDQGLDTTEIPPSRRLDSDLVETQYIVEIDNRLGSIATSDGARANVSFIDDDQIASYYFSLGTDAGYVTSNTNTRSTLVAGVDTGDATEAIAGPRGTILQFKLQSSIELNTTDYLFDKLGAVDSSNDLVATAANFKYIDTLVRVSGATTGFKLDIPVRFMKKTS
jgi:hypothetical protein